ncbi:pancreatic lipase-related protein 2-like isoform X2 [Mixophyes fleayi]
MMDTLLLVVSIAALVRAEEVCYGKLGCFRNGPPYSGTLERPISRLPWSPEVIGTQFLLFSQENPNFFEVVSAANVSASNFKTSRKSCFIIHGFLDNGYERWIIDMCKTLLQVSDLNCFSVSWSGGSHALYTQAANNVRVVGAELSLFIKDLVDNHGYHLANVYLIGHSLGAHVAGEAGKRRPGIARITGLSPAGPYFEDTPPEVRLNHADAVFVDAIHSDGTSIIANLGFGGFGMMEPVGHLDFYPNGGKHMPGCAKVHFVHYDIDDIIAGIDEKVICNHQRSHQFFQESIIRPDGFISYRGPSYSAFQEGAGFPCSNGSCSMMGYYADVYHRDPSTRQKFYLNTGNADNFLRWRYNVAVNIAGTEIALGSFAISLCGRNGCSRQYEIHDGFIHPGTSYSTFLDVENDVYPVMKVIFVWHKDALYFLNPELGASDVTVQYGPNGKTSTFCGSDLTIEDTNQTLEFCSSFLPY